MDENKHWNDFQKGDTAAFTTLYDLLWEELFCYTARLMQDKDIAADIVQEIFTKLWENKEQIQNIEQIKSYLYKTSRNSALNHIREQNIREKHLTALSNILEIDGVENTMQDILGTDMKNHILRSIESLPARMREIFYLKVFEQMSVKEIAERLNLSEQTVRNQVNMATQKLKHVFPFIILFLLQK